MAITERFVTAAAAGGGDGTSGSPWTIYEAASNAVSGDRVNIQADGEYNLTSTLVISNDGVLTSPKYFRGYSSTIGDGVKPTITLSSNYSIELGSDYTHLESLSIINSGTAVTLSAAGANQLTLVSVNLDSSPGSGSVVYFYSTCTRVKCCNCYFKSDEGFTVRTDCKTDFYACSFYRTGAVASLRVLEATDGASVSNCLFVGTTVNSWTLIDVDDDHYITRNTFFGGGNGIYINPLGDISYIADNIFHVSGSTAIDVNNRDGDTLIIGNAVLSSTTNRLTDTTDIVEYAPIELTENPFIDSSNFDFRLNNNTGGGALCRGAALSFPQIS